MNDCLRIENRHTGEVLRMRRERDASGEIVLAIEGSLPPKSSGPPPHIHFHQREEGSVIAGTLGARVGKEKLVVPPAGKQPLELGLFIAGGTPGKISWNLADARFRRLTSISSSKGFSA